jgi:hypothetical protein
MLSVMSDPDIIEGEADDDDPEVVEGMHRLAELRAREGDIPDLT